MQPQSLLFWGERAEVGVYWSLERWRRISQRTFSLRRWDITHLELASQELRAGSLPNWDSHMWVKMLLSLSLKATIDDESLLRWRWHRNKWTEGVGSFCLFLLSHLPLLICQRRIAVCNICLPISNRRRKWIHRGETTAEKSAHNPYSNYRITLKVWCTHHVT